MYRLREVSIALNITINKILHGTKYNITKSLLHIIILLKVKHTTSK